MHPNGNQNVVDNVRAGAFTRLLTEKLAVSVDSSWIRRNRTSFPQQAGFGLASLTLKGQVFEDDPHEALVAASLSWGIGRLGNQAVGAGDRARSAGGFLRQGFGRPPGPHGVAPAVWRRGRCYSRIPDQSEVHNNRHRSGNRPTWPCADDQWQYPALGIGTRIQYPLLDRPFYRRAPKRRAAPPVRAACRVCIRHADRPRLRAQDHRDETGTTRGSGFAAVLIFGVA